MGFEKAFPLQTSSLSSQNLESPCLLRAKTVSHGKPSSLLDGQILAHVLAGEDDINNVQNNSNPSFLLFKI